MFFEAERAVNEQLRMEKAMDRQRKDRWGGLVQYLSRIYISNELARALFQRVFCLSAQDSGMKERRGPATGVGLEGYVQLGLEQIHNPEG